MRSVFETCQPRPEVLTGDLKEEIFAARLRDVIEQTAEPVYRDPAVFFENTYPTEGLKLLLEEALGRLTGVRPTNNPIIRLETAFGGGKTHNLIALYHAARGNHEAAQHGMVAPALIPPSGTIAIAGVVGSDLDPSGGVPHGDTVTHTLWGELAYQLAGAAGYAFVEESDRSTKAAPGTAALERLIDDRPTLIMLDEIARHLRAAKAIPTATGKSDLAEQTVAFLMSLLEFAASKERVVVVLTLADVSDAFGQETADLLEELSDARKLSARQERVITPTGETEIAAIVTHRLFRSVDRQAAQETAERYHAYYTRLLDQGADLPHQAARAEYAAEIVTDYPFHPSLLTTLNRKTSTIPNFQKTRGALRLLAMAIRRLWTERPPDVPLIHIHHLDLGNAQIADDLTSRLQRPAFKQVIEADIASPRQGTPAHTQLIDQHWVAAGKPPFARRVATTIFLHSLTQGTATGVDPAELTLAVLQPDDDPAIVRQAIDRLLDTCWFLDFDGHRFRFKTEPSLNKIIADEIQLVGRTKAKGELDSRIRQVWRKGAFQPLYFPSEAAEVDDDAREPKLVIMHYDAATATAADTTPPDLVRKLFDYAGTAEGYRTYKNNVLFLVADKDQIEPMVEAAQKHLAIARIVGDPERLGEYTPEQREKLKGMIEASELEVRVAITKAYRYLYYPSIDAGRDAGYLARHILPAQEQGQIEKDQSALILRALRELQKVLTADDPPLSAAFVKAKAWDQLRTEMSTEDLRSTFAQRLSLRILLDINQLKKTIREGVSNGVWVYFDPAEQTGYGPDSPAPLVHISDEAMLYVPEEAKRRGIPIKGEKIAPPEERCPVCGQPAAACICGDDGVDGGDSTSGEEGRRPPALRPLRAEGAPGQVFQAIADQCAERGITALRRLVIHLEGSGRSGASDARAFGLAIPQLGNGEFSVEQHFAAEFGTDESLSLTFTGSWNRYKAVKQLTDAFGQEATKLQVRMVLTASFPEGLDPAGDQFATMKDVFTALNLGKLTMTATPAGDGTVGAG